MISDESVPNCVSDDDKTHYRLKFGNLRIGRLNCHSLLCHKDDVA